MKFHRLTVEFYWILRHNRNCGVSRWVPWDEALGSWSWKDESGEQSERKSCVTFFPVYHANWLKNHHNSAINSKKTKRNYWHRALPWSSILPDHQKKSLLLQIAIFCGFSWRIHDDSSRITRNCLPAEAEPINRPRYQTNPLLKSEVPKREKEKKAASHLRQSSLESLTRGGEAERNEQSRPIELSFRRNRNRGRDRDVFLLQENFALPAQEVTSGSAKISTQHAALNPLPFPPLSLSFIVSRRPLALSSRGLTPSRERLFTASRVLTSRR